MAKKRRSASKTTTKIVRVSAPRSPAPIIKVSAPRAAPAKHSRVRHYARRAGSMAGGLISNESLQAFGGGALFGFAVKSGVVAKLPEIPVLGRTGTAALLLDYWARHGGGQMVHRAARAAAAIAGYQLGAEGKITGDFDTSGDFAMGDATTPGSLTGDGYE